MPALNSSTSAWRTAPVSSSQCGVGARRRFGGGFAEHQRVGELLVELHRELEPGRGARRPPRGDRRPRLAVEGGVDLHHVEPARVELQLVETAGPRRPWPGRTRRSTCRARRDSSTPTCRRGCSSVCPARPSAPGPGSRAPARFGVGRLVEAERHLATRAPGSGRRIRLGCAIIRSIASFLLFGSGRVLNTGLRVLTKRRKSSASMCCSRKARVGGALLMSRSSTSTPSSARKLLAFLQVVQVGLV